MNVRGIDFTGMAYLAAMGIAGYGLWRLVKAGPAAAVAAGEAVTRTLAAAGAAVGGAVNPANPENVVNTAAVAAVQAATGDPYANPGNLLFEFFNPGTRALEKQMFGTYTANDVYGGGDMRAALAQAEASAQWAPARSAADLEDADLGAAMYRSGASVPMSVTPSFSYLTRTGKNF